MANPELGTKQICPQCQAKFYDLNKRPAHCPKCASEFDPDEAVRSRRVRARTLAPDIEADEERADQVRGKAADTDEDEEDDAVTPELDEGVDEPVSVDDDDDSGDQGGGQSDDLGEFSDDEVEDEGDVVPFLEEDEDDFDENDIEGLPGEGDDE